MKRLIGTIIMLATIIGSIYVGGWLMFIKPIIDACKAFDAGTLTAAMVGIAFLKCFFAGVVGTIIFYVGVFLAHIFND